MKDTFKKIDLFLFDMDGTIYIGNRLFDFTIDLLETIKSNGKRYLFITNNSSKSVDDYIMKLKKLGINANHDDFVTSSQATCFYLLKNHSNKCFYVCGTESLKEELKKQGIAITEDYRVADGIVMGFDTELTFKKIEDVCKILISRDVPYIATNPDYVCPTEYGSVPDCGSVCDMIYNATKKRPFVIGKPSPLMIELALEKWCVKKENALVIGDRIYTDIKSGINAGTKSLLVLSGETDREILEKSDVKPDFVFDSCDDLLKILK